MRLIIIFPLHRTWYIRYTRWQCNDTDYTLRPTLKYVLARQYPPKTACKYKGFPTTNLKNGNEQKKKKKRKLNGRGNVAFVPTGNISVVVKNPKLNSHAHGSFFFLTVTFIGKPRLGTGKGPYCIPSSPPKDCHLNPNIQITICKERERTWTN